MREGPYQGNRWFVNLLQLDWTAMGIMHEGQTALILQQQPPLKLQQLASEFCRLLDAIENWPHSPPGAVVAAQAALGLAAPYLPKVEKYTMWCRQRLARFEELG